MFSIFNRLCILLASFAPLFGQIAIDESGKIPIITYHRIGDKDSEYTRSRSSFLSDLKNLKQLGFWPISLHEFISKKINAPKGKIPVLITFDDSSESQFFYDAPGKISSGCAVGLLEKFKKENPGFPVKATFFVLPGAKFPNNLFGQPKFNQQKLEFLKNNGYDIASHTLWHANMSKYYNKAEEQLGKTQEAIEKYLPGFRLNALALPFGAMAPKEHRHRLRQGSYKGISYRNELVFDYSNSLSESVYHFKFDNDRVRRLHGFQGVFDKLFKQRQKKPQDFFVSDGQATIITVPVVKKNQIKTPAGFKLQVY